MSTRSVAAAVMGRLVVLATATPAVVGVAAVLAIEHGVASLRTIAVVASAAHAAVLLGGVAWAARTLSRRQEEAERVAEELAKSHEHYVRAVEGSTDGLWDWDVVTGSVYFSPRWKSMLGYDEKELPNEFSTWASLLHPEDSERARAMVDDYHHGRIPVFELEVRMKRKDGSYLWVLSRGTVLRDAEGKVLRMSGSHTDVDARRRSEDALKESERRFRQATDTISEAVWLAEDNVVISMSQAWTRIWGRPLPPLKELGAVWRTTLHPEDREEVLRLYAARTGALEHTYRIVRPDGEIRWVRDRMAPVYDEAGRPYRLAGVAEDVTEERQAQEALRAARDAALASAQAKSEFLANVSHELRTPLNAIQGVCELMHSQALPEPAASRAAVAQDAVSVLTAIIDDLLDVAKMEAGRMTLDPQPANVRRLLEDSAAFFREPARRKGLELRLDLSPSIPDAVRVDPLRLRQIVSNLLANAVKFTEKGSVSLAASARPVAGGLVALRVSVRDTGIGIAPETREKLFQPFAQADASTTRRYGGTGLGLAICRRLAEMMGGTIDVDSRPGEGSEFWVELSVPVESAPPSARLAPAPIAASGVRVLVVEDNPVNRQITKEMLALLGAEADLAENGAVALEALAGRAYDMVLLDCSMPVMDGYAATRALRRREAPGERTPVVAMTAHALSGDREKCLDAGMDDYLAKPLRLNDIAAALSRWTAPVDAKTLARAASMAASASPRWRDEYVEDAGRLIERMRAAAEAGMTEDLKRAAHTLKGASAALGARRLAALCARVEADGKADAELLARAAAELTAVSNALASYPIIG